MSVRVDSQLDYSKLEYSYSTLQYQKYVPESGQSSGLITQSGFETLFKIPADVVFNFSKCILEFDLTLPASATSTFLHKDSMAYIKQIQVYTPTIMLADIRNVNNYTKCVWMLENANEYFEYDPFGAGYGAGRQLRRNNSAAVNGTVNCPLHPVDNSQTSSPYFEKQYVEQSANATAMVEMLRFPLEMIRYSILSYNKSIYFGQPVFIRIYWAGINKIAFEAAANTPNPGTPYLSNITLSNIALVVAQEIDPSVRSQLMKKAETGYSFLMPWIEASMVPLSGSMQTVIVPTNRGMGKRLLRAIYSPFNQNEQLNTAYDNFSTSQTITSLWSEIDGQRIEPFNVNVTEYEDWMLMKQKLTGSITFSSNIYDYNWFWLSDFCKMATPSERRTLEDNEEKGVDISTKERVVKLTVQTTGAVNSNWYVWLITQKEVHIKGNQTYIS